jgi:hypothetical protein
MKLYNLNRYKVIIKSSITMAFTGLWLICPDTITAQESSFSKNEVAITLGGVSSSLKYDIQGTDVKDGLGYNAGLEYTHYFGRNFGISLGAEYQRYEATANTAALQGAYNTTDFEQENFEFRYKMNSVVEKQKIGFVNIPVMLVYQNQQYGFYIRGGAKIGLPVSGKFSANYNLNTTGYYEQYNGELFDPEFMGFGTFDNVSAKGDDIDTEMSYIATLELGIKQPIGKGNLYAGLYFDYGLNDIAKQNSEPVVYTVNDSGAGFKYNSILNSKNVDNLRTLSFGIKLRYSIFNF